MQHPLRRRGARLSAVTVLALAAGLFAGGAPALADEIESPTPTAPVTEPSAEPTQPGTEPSAEPSETPDPNPGEGGEPTQPGTEPTADPSESPVPTEPGEVISDVTLTDIHEGQWFFTPVSWMVAEGITKGYADQTFRPFRPVNRGEAVAFLYRYVVGDAEYNAEAAFKDVPAGHNFYQEIGWAHDAKVVKGYENGTFQPSKTMNRGEMASVLFRMVEFDPEYQVPATTPFSDVKQGKTAHYKAIASLAEAGILKGRTDKTFDPSGKVTRAEFAALLNRFETEIPED